MSRAEDVEIQVSVAFRHTESTPALKAYAVEKVTHCLQKYVNYATEASVVLVIEKRDHIAEVHVHSKGYDCNSKATTEDLYSAIDKMIDALDTQLRRQKDRQTDHKH